MLLYAHKENKTKEVISVEKKFRRSRQRERIYGYLIQSEEHPSAEMIYKALLPELPELSLGTVYRNLKVLEEMGQVRRVPSVQGTERYDAICQDHVHFLCDRCGSLRDMTNTDTGQIRSALPADNRFLIKRLDLTVTGICSKCTG